MLRTIEIEPMGNYALIYAKTPNDSLLYAGLENGNKIDEIGVIGERPYLEDIQVTGSNAFGQFQLHFFGACGANCVMNYWVEYEAGVPNINLFLDTHVQVADLDEDGISEIIATVASTTGQVKVYKRIQGKIMAADLNELLMAEHPDSVVYDSVKRMFIAFSANEKRHYQYI